jgi:hypothetical protein
VTNGGKRLTAVKKGFHESDGLWLNAQGVGINDATRQQQCVEVLGLGLSEAHVDGELLVPIRKIPAADTVGLRRYDPRFSAGLVERLVGLGELDFLETVGTRMKPSGLSGYLSHGSTP